MTQLFQRAIEEAQKLPGPAQDAIAALILEQIADDRVWEESLARSQHQLALLAQKAREDVAAGRVRPLAPRRP
ncbi:MAG TPA: hypothetical protein VF590_18955 [Isosphaeraceae bacterium]|jgi:hypothetical protein